jgi:hypothetical protein
MDLNEIAIFIKVVQLGSFSQAARVLGMPNSTVSSKITSLERRLGVTARPISTVAFMGWKNSALLNLKSRRLKVNLKDCYVLPPLMN